MKAHEICDLLEKLSPKQYACDWDNVGLHVGRKEKDVKKVLVSLDIDDSAVDYALETGTDMIVSHHPLIFKGIRQINEENIVGRRILTLAENKINAYCMHTNYDTIGGMAEAAAKRLGLSDCEIFEEVLNGEGLGRIGNLSEKMSVGELCEIVKKAFSLEKVVLFGDENAMCSRVVVFPGSGKDEIAEAIKAGADVIITGDVTYHYGIDSVAEGINVIDAGHYGIEHIFIDEISEYLLQNTDGVEVIKMQLNNPQKYI